MVVANKKQKRRRYDSPQATLAQIGSILPRWGPPTTRHIQFSRKVEISPTRVFEIDIRHYFGPRTRNPQEEVYRYSRGILIDRVNGQNMGVYDSLSRVHYYDSGLFDAKLAIMLNLARLMYDMEFTLSVPGYDHLKPEMQRMWFDWHDAFYSVQESQVIFDHLMEHTRFCLDSFNSFRRQQLKWTARLRDIRARTYQWCVPNRAELIHLYGRGNGMSKTELESLCLAEAAYPVNPGEFEEEGITPADKFQMIEGERVQAVQRPPIIRVPRSVPATASQTLAPDNVSAETKYDQPSRETDLVLAAKIQDILATTQMPMTVRQVADTLDMRASAAVANESDVSRVLNSATTMFWRLPEGWPARFNLVQGPVGVGID